MPQCNYCNRSFVNKQALHMHTESKHPDYECTYCDRTFSTSRGRDQHEEDKHPGYECRYCDREFASPGARDQHQNAKHPPRSRNIYTSVSYLSALSQSNWALAAKSAPAEQPIVNVALDALSTQEPTPESSQGVDVLTQSPEVPVTAPNPVGNLACGICGEPVATISALGTHELQHKTNSCACQICERVGMPCDCNICKRSSPLTVSVNEKPIDSVVSGELEETMLSAHSLGAIEPMAVEDSLVDACNLDVAMESQEVIDPPADRGVPMHAMDSQDEQPSLEPKREVDGERSHDLTAAHPPLPPHDKDTCLDSSTCLSEVALNITEDPGNTNLELGFPPMECDTIPCDVDVLEQHSTLDAHAVVQDSTIYERTRATQPDVSLDLTDLQSQDHNMSPPEASNDQPMVLDIDMSHEQIDGHLECDPCVPGLKPDSMSSSHSTESLADVRSPQFIGSPPVCASELEIPIESGDPLRHEQINGPLECEPCVPGLEPDITSSSHSTEFLTNGTFALGICKPVQAHSPQFIGSPPICTSELEPPAESGDPFIRNLVPSPTPSEHGSVKPPSITQDDHSHSGSRPLLSPLTSEGSADYFSDADRSSSPSSPLSDHSVVFVSAESIPEYVRENRAYLVATSAPSRPSSATSSCVHLPSVVTSLDDRAEVPPADSPSTNGPSPLYCRICLRDPCDDPTATMCGHIFCNRCIIDAVMARSACPVCNAPTLLYCLFRLDI